MPQSFKHFLRESINDKGIFKAMFVVGIPGAGKSYTLKKLSGSISPRVVCTDIAAEYLIRKFEMPLTPANWPHFKDKTDLLTKAALKNYLNGVLPLFIDGTSNDPAKILHRLGILESLGYDVGMIFIDTSIETAIRRAKQRAAQINRHVDEDFIRLVHKESDQNKAFFKSRFSFFKEIQNDESQLTDEVLSDAFKRVQTFFESNLANPIGKRYVDEMKKRKIKYLMPDLISKETLDKKLEGWYRD